MSQEVKLLVDTFDQLACEKLDNDAEALMNVTPISFDDLPESDSETEVVNDLIDLPPSPAIGPSKPKITESIEVDKNVDEIDIKKLESELLDPEHTDRRAAAAHELMKLEKIAKDTDNPRASALIKDLQKVLGVEKNSDILRVCLTSENFAKQDFSETPNSTKVDVKKRLSNYSVEPSTPKSRLFKSASARNLNSSTEFADRSLRKNTSISAGNVAPALFRRFPSDPEVQKTSKSQTGPAIKNRLKVQTGSLLAKKGPLKAVLPLGNMKKGTPSKTPQKYVRVPSSSTPNLSSRKSPKGKPSASSTPAIEKPKVQRPKPLLKPTISENESLECDLSPVVLNESGKKSPSKKCSPPRRSVESKLPRYSPRPVKTRTPSMKFDFPAKKSVICSTSLKENRSLVNSPLRDLNKLMPASKKISRSLSTIKTKARTTDKFFTDQLESEKENLA